MQNNESIENSQISELVSQAKLNKLSRQDKERLFLLLKERERRKSLTTIASVFKSLYPWQHKFIGSTLTARSCMLMAANRVGKTYTGCLVDAIHATGDYPEGWTGHKFEHAPLIWVLGYSGEKIRDLLQMPIVGTYSGGELTGGLIPKDRIVDALPMMGTPRCCREVRVKHKSGGISRLQFWSYTQGQHALMGDSLDFYHIDEEPKDSTIYPQVITRTATGDRGQGGRGILTFTPENGRTELVINFMDNPSPSQYMQRATWDDAEHLTEETKEALLSQFPPYQRDMRTKGLPLLGTGLIFDLDITKNKVSPFECPDHFYLINGMDFGWEHPQAHVQLWWDRDKDIIYVANAWKKSKVQPYEAWECVKGWANRIPTAWPHDGLQTEKGSGKQQKSYYAEAGWDMLEDMATWEDGGNGVEHGIMELYNRLKLGTLLFIDGFGMSEMFEEFLQFHRDDKGKIVKIQDDLISALRYAYMMKRFAKRKYDILYSDDHNEYEPPQEYW
jgi:phage terminase large subunit-like protein